MPKLVAELLKRGWSDEDVKAALGNNLLRVLKQAEAVRSGSDTQMSDDRASIDR